jgi:hypothetical protein
MLMSEIAADQAMTELTGRERHAYALANPHSPFLDSAAVPSRPKPTKRAFNSTVHRHFSAGRRLTEQHRRAISEGLRRWHAAHGNGTYSKGQRSHAIRHLNKRFITLAEHHLGMHAVHRQRAAAARKSGNTEHHTIHMNRARASMKKHRLYSSLVRPATNPRHTQPTH